MINRKGCIAALKEVGESYDEREVTRGNDTKNDARRAWLFSTFHLRGAAKAVAAIARAIGVASGFGWMKNPENVAHVARLLRDGKITQAKLSDGTLGRFPPSASYPGWDTERINELARAAYGEAYDIEWRPFARKHVYGLTKILGR